MAAILLNNISLDFIHKASSALANEKRIAILNHCAEKSLNLTEIKELIKYTYSTVHGYIKDLDKAGLVSVGEEINEKGKCLRVRSLYKVEDGKLVNL